MENLGQGWHCLMLMIFAFVLYSNTLGHQYAQDDAIVIYDNMYTMQGTDGIKGHLTKDTFFGFFKTEGKSKLVSGGRYRPLTPIMFCIEYEIFGDKPFIGHLMNIFWYGVLCCMIYLLTARLISDQITRASLFAFTVVIIFACHPIHTEAVANIKGRDEIMSLLGAVTAFFFAIKYVDNSKLGYLVVCLIMFFLGLMSKENTITYLAIIPVGIILFRQSRKRLLPVLGALALSTLAFLVIRTQILGLDLGGTPMELMNNPFLKWDGQAYQHYSGLEKTSSILVSLGKYLWLMLFPITLCHDYYPASIELVSLLHWKPLISLLSHLSLIVIALSQLKKRPIVAFGIFYYFASLSIVSNIVFPIGTHMSERFLFMPSLGLLMSIVGYFWTFRSHKIPSMLSIVCVLVITLFSVRTIIRNPIWFDDYTLFTGDTNESTQSAKLLNAAGGVLITRHFNESDLTIKSKRIKEATTYLEKAVQLHPTYTNAYQSLGTGYNVLKKYDKAINVFDRVLSINPEYPNAMENLIITLQEAGKSAGQSENFPECIKYLTRAEVLESQNIETLRLLGIAYGNQGNHETAIKYFEKVKDQRPNDASSYVNLGIAYKVFGDKETARLMLDKAIELDPNSLNNLRKQ